tara:strand:- start:438 stop:1664 length:1227 start_codon:yes stop_codon:yes gene_type:complete
MVAQHHLIEQYTNEQFELMVEQLHHLCHINSGSDNLDGLAQMNQELVKLFTPVSDHIKQITMDSVQQIDMNGHLSSLTIGSGLLIQKRPELTRRVLLSGHMDTVFSTNHSFQQCRELNKNVINGPGVADMKGGLLVILHALSVFEHSPMSDELGWDVYINADEEIGSLASGHYLNKLSSKYQAGLVYEPSMTADGIFAKNRKGSGKLTLIARGVSAHAGRDFNKGKNAICHLADVICQINQLNGQRDGVTINIGKIAGGEALNVVPDKAVAKLDIRIKEADDEYWVRASINNIIKSMCKEDFKLDVLGDFSRPVKKVNTGTIKLFNRIKKLGKNLGLHLDWHDSGGCCDGNNLAQKGMPVIDTLGVRGGKIHSSDEYICLDSLKERVILSGLILSDLASGGLEKLKEN